MTFHQFKPNEILRGPVIAEPVEVIITVPMASAVKLVGRGVQTGKVVDTRPGALRPIPKQHG